MGQAVAALVMAAALAVGGAGTTLLLASQPVGLTVEPSVLQWESRKPLPGKTRTEAAASSAAPESVTEPAAESTQEPAAGSTAASASQPAPSAAQEPAAESTPEPAQPDQPEASQPSGPEPAETPGSTTETEEAAS